MNQRMRRELRHPNRSWRVDETYVCIAGRWSYLYRAVDSTGETIDFVLSPNRDLIAAKLFLRLALSGASGVRPRVINVDGHPAYARAIAELKESGDLSRSCRCRPSPYINNRTSICNRSPGRVPKCESNGHPELARNPPPVIEVIPCVEIESDDSARIDRSLPDPFDAR